MWDTLYSEHLLVVERVAKRIVDEVQAGVGYSFVNLAQIYSSSNPKSPMGLEHFVSVSVLKVLVLSCPQS